MEISLRDVARLMLTISDNTAADVLIRRVGIEQVKARLAALGFTGFHLPDTIQHEFDSAARDAGFAGWDAMADAVRDAIQPEEGKAIWQRVLASPGMRPGRISSATADDMAALVRAVWRNEAGLAEACSKLRRIMGQQRLTRKIATGFGPEVLPRVPVARSQRGRSRAGTARTAIRKFGRLASAMRSVSHRQTARR